MKRIALTLATVCFIFVACNNQQEATPVDENQPKHECQHKKDGQHKVVRANAKVLAESVTETENNYVDSGMIYIVDEEATKAWHKAKEAKANPVKATKATKEEKATDKE